MPLAFASLIREIGRGTHGFRDLSVDDAQALFAAMLADEVPALELGAILIAMRIKGESLAETTGFMRAVDAHVGRLAPPRDRPRPVVLPSYNGARRQPNLTALLALLLKRYGVPVLMHGLSGTDAGADDGASEQGDDVGAAPDHAFGRVTTAEILMELGIEPAATLVEAQSRLDYDNIAYVPAGVVAPGLARLMGHRARLGVRSSAHSLAKLIDPFGGEGFRVVSVSHPDYLVRMREFLAATHANAMLLRGTEGEPVANPRRQPQIEMFDSGEASVCAEAEMGTIATLPRLPARIDAPATAAWIARALSGDEPVPDPLITQLSCCLEGARRSATRSSA